MDFESNQTQIINTEFMVGNSSLVSEVSTIIVTATSAWDGAQNSAVAYLVVISCVCILTNNLLYIMLFIMSNRKPFFFTLSMYVD